MKKKVSKGIRLFAFMSVLLIGSNIATNAQTDLPKIIQPSPENAALFKFQDYPMDYSTGLPQISVPLYQVTSGSLSVPISISYHASGRKVYDQDGTVALGWSLNAGGVIARTAYGSPDFGNITYGTYKFPYPFNTDNLSNLNDLEYLEKIIHYGVQSETQIGVNVQPWLDSEYDIFSYSVNGLSGKFIFKDNNNVKTPVLLPYKPYKITPTFTLSGLSKIELIDDKGVYYSFEPGDLYATGYNTTTSSWVLTKMISADKTDTIAFIYGAASEERMTINQSAVLIDNWNMGGEAFPTTNLSYLEVPSHEPYQVVRLKQIDFNQGKILFNLIDGGSGGDKINNIQVVNLKNEVIKTIQFNRSLCYSQSELFYATNKLDSLVFKDATGTGIEKFAFEYYPLFSSNGQLNVRYCDWWGYYNNSGQTSYVPRYTNVPYIGSSGALSTIDIGNPLANREPNLQALQSGVIKKIIYPTGGSTEFFYENNKCTLNGTAGVARNGPGLRIYQIKSKDSNGPDIIKTYKYGLSETGYGAIDLLPDLTNMASEITYLYLSGYGWVPDRGGFYRERTFYGGFTGELSALADRPVIYPEVAEYQGTEIVSLGKTIYKYDYQAWAASAMPVLRPINIVKKHIYDYNYWNLPSLIKKTDYKRVSNTSDLQFQIRREVINLYSANTIEYVKGLHVQRNLSVPQTGLGPGDNGPLYSEKYATLQISGNLLGADPKIYTFSPYQIPGGYKNLSSTSETIYNDDGSTTTNSISYQYNSNQLLNKTTKSTSTLGPLITDIKYPTDYTGIPVLTQMITANMLGYPVEEFESNNTTPLTSVKTNYYNFGTVPIPRIYPQSIETKKGTNAYEPRINYYGYDADGNPTSVAKEKDLITSYIWDYKNAYPVAEVKNAVTNEIAFTSFEADGSGNWSGLNAVNVAATGNTITGSRFYNFNGTTLSKSGLTAATSYIVSYWTKNGMYNVNGTPASGWPKNLRTVTINGNTWTNWEHKVTGVTSITISGTGSIDELRLYPANAFMTTYTFTPLIGMSSQADVNNRVTYYEYDNYGRLKLIRDMNNNIIKTFNYSYQSATP